MVSGTYVQSLHTATVLARGSLARVSTLLHAYLLPGSPGPGFSLKPDHLMLITFSPLRFGASLPL